MHSQLSDRIRAARRMAHWSQAELALRLDVSASAVGHWERGAGSAPSSRRVFELARLTGVSAQWLTTGTGPMRAEMTPATASPTPALGRDEEYLLRSFRRLSQTSRAYVLALVGREGVTNPVFNPDQAAAAAP